MAKEASKKEIRKNLSMDSFFWKNTRLWAVILIGLALLFSYFRLIHFTEGGDVTWFSMFFVYLLGYFFGGFKGMLFAFFFSLLKFLGDMGVSYITPLESIVDTDHMTAEVLDYIFSYTLVAAGGFFAHPFGVRSDDEYWKKYPVRKKREFMLLLIGYLVGMLLRFISSVVNFVCFYSRPEKDFLGNLGEAILYCLGYVGVEALLTVLFLLIPVVHKSVLYCRYVATNKYPFNRNNI